jgi:hypothetical protein
MKSTSEEAKSVVENDNVTGKGHPHVKGINPPSKGTAYHFIQFTRAAYSAIVHGLIHRVSSSRRRGTIQTDGGFRTM